MKKILTTVALLAASFGASSAYAGEHCGDISMGEFNWASGELLANWPMLIKSSWRRVTVAILS